MKNEISFTRNDNYINTVTCRNNCDKITCDKITCDKIIYIGNNSLGKNIKILFYYPVISLLQVYESLSLVNCETLI